MGKQKSYKVGQPFPPIYLFESSIIEQSHLLPDGKSRNNKY